MFLSEMPRQNPLENQCILFKNKEQEGKTGPFWKWIPVREGRSKKGEGGRIW
jgi:hypothetical protein